jgi:hypothetical protein
MMPRAAVWESTVGCCAFGAFRPPPACLAVWPGTTATAPASAGGSVETGMSRAWRKRVEARRERGGAALFLLSLPSTPETEKEENGSRRKKSL